MKRFPLFLLAACGCLLGDSIGPSETDALGLHLHLSIHPETVNSGDDFGARLVLENPTADTVHFEG